jgi:hypothetical protein
MNKLFTIILALILSLTAVQPVAASGAKTNGVEFGSCVNPQWSVSQVNKGNDHGVVGHTESYAGTDTIYKSGGNALQCLCIENGKGVETKWMDASGLSDSQVATYKKEGWIYVATGSNWGLKDVPYLAKNSDFACKSKEAAAPKVSTLASTGNVSFIYFLILMGAASLIAGLTLGFRRK